MPTDAIEAAQKQLTERIKALQRTKELIVRARKDSSTTKRPAALLRKLASDLRTAPTEPPGPDIGKLGEIVSGKADELAAQFDKHFQTSLREHAAAANLPVTRSTDCFTVGPFHLRVDQANESATLEYAKVKLERGLAIDAAKIVARAAELTKSLLMPPGRTELQTLAADVEEAIRVVLARRKQTLAGDLRAELPAVFREIAFIRQGDGLVVSKATFRDYPLVRFIVEIKTLIQSELNASRSRRFKLETAVIENTKNPRKSVFIPQDMEKGYGEGMYYQAIVLLTGG